MATDIRVEICGSPETAAARRAYLQGLGFSVHYLNSGTYVTDDQSDVGGPVATVNASPGWVIVAEKD